jgi:hypothetical protein
MGPPDSIRKGPRRFHPLIHGSTHPTEPRAWQRAGGGEEQLRRWAATTERGERGRGPASFPHRWNAMAGARRRAGGKTWLDWPLQCRLTDVVTPSSRAAGQGRAWPHHGNARISRIGGRGSGVERACSRKLLLNL